MELFLNKANMLESRKDIPRPNFIPNIIQFYHIGVMIEFSFSRSKSKTKQIFDLRVQPSGGKSAPKPCSRIIFFEKSNQTLVKGDEAFI